MRLSVRFLEDQRRTNAITCGASDLEKICALKCPLRTPKLIRLAPRETQFALAFNGRLLLLLLFHDFHLLIV
ncbi:hypothetical protein LCGC14_2963410, partial [marine sediment metagenome]